MSRSDGERARIRVRPTWRRNHAARSTAASTAPPPIRTLISGSIAAVVAVPPGTYHERILLDRPVILTALEGAGTVKVVADSGTALTVSSGATVRGLVIETRDPAHPALVIADGSPLFEECEVLGGRVEVAGEASPTFRRCQIRATAVAGLHATGRSRPQLEECLLEDVQGDAVAVTATATANIRTTRIAGAAGAGVRIDDRARGALVSCIISGSQGPGLWLAGQAGALLRSCEITGGSAEGVRVDGSSMLDDDTPDDDVPDDDAAEAIERGGDTAAAGAAPIRGVTLVGGRVGGVATEGIVATAGVVRLLGTWISDAGRTGVVAGGAATIELQAAAITDAAVHGLVACGAARVRAVRLAVTRCGENGVVATHDAEVELTDGQFTGTARTVISLTESAFVEAVNCRIGQTPEHGVLAAGNALLVLGDSAVDTCGQAGIQVDGRSDATLRGCTVSDSDTGILLATLRSAFLTGCTVTGVQRTGIEIGPGSSPQLNGCSVIGAGSAGIFINSHSDAQLDGCRIERTADCGLVVWRDAEPQVRSTTITGTGKNGLLVSDGGRGLFENCDLSATMSPAIHVGMDAAPVLRHCLVHDTGEDLSVSDGARPVIEDCHAAGVSTAALAEAPLRRATVRDMARPGQTGMNGAPIMIDDAEVVATEAATAEAGGPAGRAATLPDLLDTLNRLIGLRWVKQDVAALLGLTPAAGRQLEGDLAPHLLGHHLAFAGNPGTGKTTVARLYGQMLAALGVLERGHLVRADRGGNVGDYAAQAGPYLAAAFRRALGGVLMIDEAWALTPAPAGTGPEREVVATLVRLMDEYHGEVVVIIAGGPEPLRRFLLSHPGLASRLSRTLHFDDYSGDELAAIVEQTACAQHYLVPGPTMAALRDFFERLIRGADVRNGRTARQVFEQMAQRQARRITAYRDPRGMDDPARLLPADLPAPSEL
jgi:Right handed beta helix region/ATPase family associated with various cellular activities (AAA)/AAA lid domain